MDQKTLTTIDGILFYEKYSIVPIIFFCTLFIDILLPLFCDLFIGRNIILCKQDLTVCHGVGQLCQTHQFALILSSKYGLSWF